MRNILRWRLVYIYNRLRYIIMARSTKEASCMRLHSLSWLGDQSLRKVRPVTYWPKIANSAHPLSFSALVQGDSLRIYGKALWFLILESSKQLTAKIWWSCLAPFLTDPPMWRTDGQNCDGWDAPNVVAAFARKNCCDNNPLTSKLVAQWCLF